MTSSAAAAAIAWPERARALARSITRDDLEPRAVTALEAIPGQATVAIACSGGADSTALVLLLWAHFPSRRGRWLILHFDHGLRGPDSAADAKFVRELARGLGERCVARTWRHRRKPGTYVSEAVARRARWSFFEAALRSNKAALIATGHQANDVAETMLMRLTRGAGTAGLAGPRPVQVVADGGTRVRPLLSLSAHAVRDALCAAGVPWREDRTNAAEAHFRNRVRHRVLPALAEASPQEVLGGAATSRALLEEDAAALDAIAEAAIAAQLGRQSWDLKRIRRQPAAVVRRVVLNWLAQRRLAENLKRPAVERLLRAVLAREDLRVSAGRETEIVFRNGTLTVQNLSRKPRSSRFPQAMIEVGEARVFPGGGEMSARVCRLSPAMRRRILAGEIPPDETVFLKLPRPSRQSFVVRAWRPGDRYRPLGAPGRMKIQDMFVNRKIPREQRISRPVVCLRDGGPVWVPGFPPAQELAVQPETKLVVQLTYSPPGPMVNGAK